MAEATAAAPIADGEKSNTAKTVQKAVGAAEETVRRPLVKKFARFGFYAKGVLFIVVGALSIMLSVGIPEGRIADPTGALAAVAAQPFGKLLLFVFVCGAVGHGVWNILRAVADVDDAGDGWLGITKRVIAAGTGLFYIGLAITAFQIILAARTAGPSGQAEETLVSVLLAVPLIRAVLLFIIGSA